jgi:hypothetical protein
MLRQRLPENDPNLISNWSKPQQSVRGIAEPAAAGAASSALLAAGLTTSPTPPGSLPPRPSACTGSIYASMPMETECSRSRRAPRPAPPGGRRLPAVDARACSLAVHRGSAAGQELLQYEGAYLTEAFVQRVFEECQVHRRRSGPFLALCAPLCAHTGARGADLRRGDGLQVLPRLRAGDAAPLDPAGLGPRPAAAQRDTVQRPIFLVEFPHCASPGRVCSARADHPIFTTLAAGAALLLACARPEEAGLYRGAGARKPQRAARSARWGSRSARADASARVHRTLSGSQGGPVCAEAGPLVLRRARLS